jgi:hypothetical protein
MPSKMKALAHLVIYTPISFYTVLSSYTILGSHTPSIR